VPVHRPPARRPTVGRPTRKDPPAVKTRLMLLAASVSSLVAALGGVVWMK
jgi:hypothetical protein